MVICMVTDFSPRAFWIQPIVLKTSINTLHNFSVYNGSKKARKVLRNLVAKWAALFIFNRRCTVHYLTTWESLGVSILKIQCVYITVHCFLQRVLYSRVFMSAKLMQVIRKLV